MDDEQLPEHDGHLEPEHGEPSATGAGEISAKRTNEPAKAKDVADPDASGERGQADELAAFIDRMVLSSSYSGALPEPKLFRQYPREVQERMCKWNDAFTIDESKRQDRLVDAEIRQAKTGMWMSFILFVVCIAIACVGVFVVESPWPMAFLSIPVISMIANMFIPVNSKSSRTQPRPAGSDVPKDA